MVRILRKYKYLISIIIFVILIIVSIVIRISLEEDSYVFYEDKEEELDIDSKIEEDKEDREKIFVDIKGAVTNPGVYEIEKDKRVIDLVEMAGGLLENADTTLINMSKKLEDAMVVIIYTKEEVERAISLDEDIDSDVNKIIDNTCVCPNITNDACLREDNNIDNKININIADIGELQTLPGIGEAKAKDIVEYRNNNGEFKSIEEIKNVSGIGDSLYEKIKDYITI